MTVPGAQGVATPYPRQLTADELIALNEQILWLARAGVPLESGLLAAARELQGNAAVAARALSERLAAGQPLHEAIASAAQLFDPTYQMVLEVGLRTGRLAAAVESWTKALRRVVEVRRLVKSALVYPLMIIVLVYVFFVLSLLVVWPQFIALARDLRTVPAWIVAWAEAMTETAVWWAPVPAVLALGLGLWWRWRTGRALGLGSRVALSSEGKLQRLAQEVVFCEMLGQLVEVGAPLVEALELAGRVCGNRFIQDDARRLADLVRSGSYSLPHLASPMGLHPLLQVAILHQARSSALSGLLRRRIDWLTQQFQWRLWLIRTRLPLILGVTVGGVWVLLFLLWSIVPWYWLLWKLSQEVQWPA